MNFKSVNLWLVFLLYVICIGISELTHEPWGDELETWCLIKEAHSLLNLLSNIRYDGHPPVWYIPLFVFSKFSHSIGVIQMVAFLISCTGAFLFIFYSKFPITLKIISLLGYYFLFEYALFSRNYAIAILIAFLLCIVIDSHTKFKNVIYYFLLLLLANSHLLAFFLACSFHLFFLTTYWNKHKDKKWLSLHFLIGGIILMSCICFIFSPSDMAPHKIEWHKGQLIIAAQAPLRSFIPIPAWWKYHFWNTNAIWEITKDTFILELTALIISGGLIALTFIIQLKCKKALMFFGLNLLLNLLLAMVFPLTTARYVGFIYIGFLISLWLNWNELSLNRMRKIGIYTLLILQIPGSIIALPREWTNQFSKIHELRSVVEQVPPGQQLITDYWGLNYLSAIIDSAYYCVESKKIQSFIRLDKSTIESLGDVNRYTKGTEYFFKHNNVETVFLLCNTPPDELNKLDRKFNEVFFVKLVVGRIGSIERFSDLYLYKVAPRK